MFPFRVRIDNSEIIDKLKAVPSVNGYLISLIEKDIHRDTLTIKQIKEALLPVFSKYGIHEVYLFGSYARGEANNDSDVDIYCEAGSIKTFIEQGYLEDELYDAIGKNVDIVFIGSKMNTYFKEQLEKDKIRLC